MGTAAPRRYDGFWVIAFRAGGQAVFWQYRPDHRGLGPTGVAETRGCCRRPGNAENGLDHQGRGQGSSGAARGAFPVMTAATTADKVRIFLINSPGSDPLAQSSL